MLFLMSETNIPVSFVIKMLFKVSLIAINKIDVEKYCRFIGLFLLGKYRF